MAQEVKLTDPCSDARPGLLFDLDGTLVDSLPDLAAALNRLLREEARAPLPAERVIGMVGDGLATLVERALAATGALPEGADFERLVARCLAFYETALTVKTRPYDGAVATLAALRAAGWRLGVCTNKPVRAARAVVRDLGLADFFDTVVGGDSLPVRKPHGGHLTGALADLEGRPERGVMIGDGRNDVLAARAAGMPVVLASFGYGGAEARALGPDRVIDHFGELPAALESLP